MIQSNVVVLFFFIIQTLQARISVDGNMITDEPRPCTIQVQKHPRAKYHINEQGYKKNYIFLINALSENEAQPSFGLVVWTAASVRITNLHV